VDGLIVLKKMSRSIHKTIKQIAKDNSKKDLSDPTNPDLVEYAKKRQYKSEEQAKRHSQKAAKRIDQI